MTRAVVLAVALLFVLPPSRAFFPAIHMKAVFGSGTYCTMVYTAKGQSANELGSSTSTCIKGRKSKRLYSFEEARKIARGHGFSSKKEFIDYDCAGAYQLPKDADVVWKDDWRGWDDFLGVPLTFEEGRKVARALPDIKAEADYLHFIKSKTIPEDDAASRLPYRPDLLYKAEWISWEDFLIE